MVKVTSMCTSCVQAVTNPLCPYCFTKQVMLWLRDKKIERYQMHLIKQGFKKLLNESEETPSDVHCILCGSYKVNLCTYCFTNKALRILEKVLKEGQVLEDFEDDFNTVIWRI